MTEPVVEVAAPAPLASAIRGLCPRCGSPGLFTNWLAFADRCRVCGLDFSGFNVGDGPAAILTLVLGSLIVGAAIFVQLAYGPPVWLQMLFWLPITLFSVVGSLRIAKAALLGAEYRTAAREGRIVS